MDLPDSLYDLDKIFRSRHLCVNSTIENPVDRFSRITAYVETSCTRDTLHTESRGSIAE